LGYIKFFYNLLQLIIIQQATIHQITSTCHYVTNFAMFDKAYV